MRLVRFLAAGKSLVGLTDNEGRYRLPNGQALPRFGRVGEAGVPAAAESMRQPLPPGVTEVASSDPGIAPVAAPVGVPVAPPSNPPQSKLAQQLGTGEDKKRSFLRKLFGGLPWYREAPEIRGIPAFSRRPVQTELSLENVKVVRNDLSESDLEFQSARNKPGSNPFLKQQAGEPVEMAPTPTNPPVSGEVASSS